MSDGTDRFEWDRMAAGGFVRCVWCGIVFGAEGRDDDIRGLEHPPGIGGGVNATYGPVKDRAGREYEHVIDSEPGAYLLHPSCYKGYRAERAGENNAPLTQFMPGGGDE